VFVTVLFEIKNTGKVAGAEVVQLYVHAKNPSVMRPEKELKGFKKVFLKPGEKQTVTIPLDQRAFAFYDPAKPGWVAEAGDYQIQIGSSSRDLRLKERFHLGQTVVEK
jgi:beta-glucosidase